ncbi:glucokinase [Pseudogulbenkiania sp. NH8B]|uniref:glucokinase n=1 Tax=Pseudogulbenkiania sp. (strain NH8B) TaxID=748280 RepID=UPI000227986A|nr:glucokinase [Pseudogulbenkiania sp. NH8B]BAK74966.1 glucokinase [Pseudogulbenkiania sp. NH8B]
MFTGRPDSFPWLVADIGGTNARFALYTGGAEPEQIKVLACADYPTLEAAVRAYLADVGATVRHASIGIANPVTGDWVQMTNHHWAFSIEATRQALALESFLVINDWAAMALALPHLPADALIKVGGGEAVPGAPCALIGPGTGLGVSALVPHAHGATPVPGEGGHVSFAPFDEREAQIWHFARERYGHVSAERLLSGPGLVLIYQALAALAGEEAEDLRAADISTRALSGECPRCRETLDAFCAMLGTAAANLTLTLGARGGVYLGGGIVLRLLDYFQSSPFRARFEDKGRFSGYLAAVPVYIMTHAMPALLGATAALAAHLEEQHA